MSTTTPGADQLQALINYSNNKTGASDTTVSNAVTRLVEGYGENISDGIVVKARDSNGYATEVDYYNADGEINIYQFGNGKANAANGWPFAKVTKVNLKGSSTFKVRGCAFYYAASLVDIDWDKIVEFPGASSSNTSPASHFRSCLSLITVNAPNLTGGLPIYCFFGCTNLTTVYLPKITALHGYVNDRGCLQTNSPNLTTVEVGSIGYTVTYVHQHAFSTSMAGTITIYTVGDNVDTFLTKIRTATTSATVIFKASEATTYNGTSYAAGDTILTSTPNS